jgi:RNA polymerase sigma factor (sigma-70 family)
MAPFGVRNSVVAAGTAQRERRILLPANAGFEGNMELDVNPFYLQGAPNVLMDGEEKPGDGPKRGAVDPEIVAKASHGDARALEALLRALTPSLLRVAVRLAGDETTAEELVTEALYRGATKLGKLREPEAAGAWFRRILLNLWRDHLRRTRKQDLFLEDLPEPAAPASFDPSARIEAIEESEALARAVSSLPPLQRAALTLQLEGGLSVEEIADEIGSTADRVKANLWHARRRLREILSGKIGKVATNGES